MEKLRIIEFLSSEFYDPGCVSLKNYRIRKVFLEFCNLRICKLNKTHSEFFKDNMIILPDLWGVWRSYRGARRRQFLPPPT